MTRVYGFVVGALFMILFAPGSADACSCSRNCNPKACDGGCSIDLPDPCGCTCSGGLCDYNCKGSGGASCREASQQGTCEGGLLASSDPLACAPGESPLVNGWAVIEYFTDGQSTATEADVRVLASSSPSDGEKASRQFLHRLNQQYALMKKEAEKSWHMPPEPQGRLRSATLVYGVSPRKTGSRPIVSLRLKKASRSIEPGTRAYVWGRTDGTGRVVEVKILHSMSAGGDRIGDLVKDTLAVRSEGHEPAEFAGFVGVFEGQRIGYALSTYVPADTTVNDADRR
jgi:hypothetical protein